MKSCLNPGSSLPQSRLPPGGTEHCDMSAILHELQSLHAELCKVACLHDEISALKIELEAVQARCTKEQLDDGDFPPLPSVEAYMKTAAIPSLCMAKGGTLAGLVRELKDSGMEPKKAKQRRRPVVGSSSNNSCVKSVATSRVTDVFVSRLHPMTTVAEVKDCVKVIKGDNLHIEEVQCEKLKARYEHLYSSFSMQIRLNSIDMKRALDLLIIIIIIQNLYSAIMPLGGYRGAGKTGR